MTLDSDRQAAPTNKRRLPILVRHAVSLAVVFALALPLSYYVGQRINRSLQLNKLESVDRAAFDEGLAYVLNHAGDNSAVFDRAIKLSATLPADRAADLLLTAASSQSTQYSQPAALFAAIGPVIDRLSIEQAVGLYDALIKLETVDSDKTAALLLNHMKCKSDDELLIAVDLLDARLLWSRELVPRDKWIAWLALLAGSPTELSQLNAARMLGELPDSVDQPKIAELLGKLAQSASDKVRAVALQVTAGYAAIATDPTDFEQILFTLGNDANNTIARRAWLIVGHLKPVSGYAVNWKAADPHVAKAMLWAAAKTSPDNPHAVWEAYDNPATRDLSLVALAELPDEQSQQRLRNAIGEHEPEVLEIDPQRMVDLLSSDEPIPPSLISIACVSVLANHADAAELADRLIRREQSSVRQFAALLAGLGKLRPTMINGDFGTFRKIYTENPDLTTESLHAMSDEKLRQLGLERVDALSALLEAAEAAPPSANRQQEIKLLKLARWMRGDTGDAFTPIAEAMLFDKTLPTPTVLMALLHQRRPIALDYLLGDRLTHRPDLYALFVQERWWHVFQHFVDTSELPLWLWADARTQAFQIESMCQWHAVNRWKIERGDWPDPAVE